MTWDDIDLEEGLWIQPREVTKSDRTHEVPLSDMAIKILQGLPNMGDYVFTSAGNRPFENFSRDKKALESKIKANLKKRNPDAPARIVPWTIHDLRRTAASGMARLGVAPHIVEKILNHTSGTISGVAAVYNRYQYADEMREALDLWAAHIEKILTMEHSASVLRVPRKKT